MVSKDTVVNLSAVYGCPYRLSNALEKFKICPKTLVFLYYSLPRHSFRLILLDNFKPPYNALGETQQVEDSLRWLAQFLSPCEEDILLFDKGNIKWQSKEIWPTDEDTKAGFFKQPAFVSTIASIQIQKCL